MVYSLQHLQAVQIVGGLFHLKTSWSSDPAQGTPLHSIIDCEPWP